MSITVERDVVLAPRTTLGVGGPARHLVRVTTVGELREALHLARGTNDKVLVLGGGSNVLVGDGGWPGLVIQMALPGVTFEDDGSEVLVHAGAGVIWDDLVAQCVERDLAGLECLSGIPGLVGATPMQNVGAYGQEVSDTMEVVDALERATGQIVEITPRECAFGYRTSMFKGSERWIITYVTFRLKKSATSKTIAYAELAKALGIEAGGTAPLRQVRETVIRLRRGKGMVVDAADPDSKSAGSFFTNPIVEADAVADLAARLPAGTQIPQWAQPDGRVKLSAGWLIERAGFAKGTIRGNAGISSKHALALINRGGATAGEVLALAREIQEGVLTQLGIELEPEPIIV
jgi:UDP-N-acetylmuramate dehydrogenase